MLIANALFEHKGILRTNGEDQPKTQTEASD
jgi:hypothetical protein